MYQMEKNTAETLVVTREAKALKSFVNATTWSVRCQFGSLRLAVQLAWRTDDEGSRPSYRSGVGCGSPLFAKGVIQGGTQES
jgi:hypothetical protein